MASLRLVAIDGDLLAAFRESRSALESHVGATVGPSGDALISILEQTAVFLASNPRDPAWGCFLAVDEAAGQVVGTCGYKGGPAADGSVEVAYYTLPAFEGRGFATAMAAELRARAGRAGRAGRRRVVAHTLPERNASCRVLEKAGFVFAGEVTDPDDGPVWQWAADAEPFLGLPGQEGERGI